VSESGSSAIPAVRARELVVGYGTRKVIQSVDLEVPVIDTNGAGDGLAVGFLTSYVLEGRSLEASIMRGQITARHTCSLKACTSELITRQGLEQSFDALQKAASGTL